MSPTHSRRSGVDDVSSDPLFGQFLRRCLRSAGHAEPARWSTIRHRRRSTFRLELVDIDLDDGTELQLVCKWTGLGSVARAHRRGKVAWRHHPGRESWCYQHLLAPLGTGTARCLGVEPDRRWLLLESVPGHPLAETDDPTTWERAAAWLAAFHRDASRPPGPHPLVSYDVADAERAWVRAISVCSWDRLGALSGMRRSFEQAAAVLADDEPVVVHGEWYPTNVVIDPASDRICPLDWELAGLGPAALDVAAVTTGWPADRATELVDVYCAATGVTGRSARSRFDRSWAAARVVTSLGHLGAEVRVPLERAHDWWGELDDAVAHLEDGHR